MLTLQLIKQFRIILQFFLTLFIMQLKLLIQLILLTF
jgi:hypothetical protein